MNPRDLVVGMVYFMVTYPDASLTSPVVLTYRYLGKNLVQTHERDAEEYYFRFLPPFSANDPPATGSGVGRTVYPDLFSGWGEKRTHNIH